MKSSAIVDIQEKITALSLPDQLLLIEGLVHQLRERVDPANMRAELAAMAADPEIQSELRKINEEFAIAERDGLGED